MITYRGTISVTAVPGSEALKLSPTDDQNLTGFNVCETILQTRYSIYKSYSYLQKTPHANWSCKLMQTILLRKSISLEESKDVND